MTKEQVRGLETEPLEKEEETQLIYRGILVGRDTTIFYDFIDGVLVSGAYYIDGATDVDDIAAYEELVELLRTKYGEPDSSGLEWRQLAKRVRVDTYGELAKAIATGEAQVRSVWDTPETRIVVVCVEDSAKYNALLFALYSSQEHQSKKAGSQFRADLELI